jgi:Mg2+ and Co2+ transporter CorA
MNGEQQAQQQAVGLQRAGGAQTRPIQQGRMAELVGQYEKNNARLNELIMIQRDNITRIIGTNPVDEPPQKETEPQSSGVISDLERAVYYQNELNTKLNAITDALASL